MPKLGKDIQPKNYRRPDGTYEPCDEILFLSVIGYGEDLRVWPLIPELPHFFPLINPPAPHAGRDQRQGGHHQHSRAFALQQDCVAVKWH